jgi:hypothetical protein
MRLIEVHGSLRRLTVGHDVGHQRHTKGDRESLRSIGRVQHQLTHLKAKGRGDRVGDQIREALPSTKLAPIPLISMDPGETVGIIPGDNVRGTSKRTMLEEGMPPRRGGGSPQGLKEAGAVPRAMPESSDGDDSPEVSAQLRGLETKLPTQVGRGRLKGQAVGATDMRKGLTRKRISIRVLKGGTIKSRRMDDLVDGKLEAPVHQIGLAPPNLGHLA